TSLGGFFLVVYFFFQAEDGIRDRNVTGVQTCALPILKESSGQLTASPRRARIRQTLVVAQVALSLMLLVSAGLFLRTLQNAQAQIGRASCRERVQIV